MSPASPFNPPPPDAPTELGQTPLAPAADSAGVVAPNGEAAVVAPGVAAPTFGEPMVAPPIITAPAPASAAPLQTPLAPAPPTPAETVWPEPPRAHAATNPLLAMLLGALLSCALVGGGILIGRQSAGAPPIGGSVAEPDKDPIVGAVKIIGPAVMNVDTTFGKPAAKKSKTFLPAPGAGPEDDGPPEGGKGKGTGFIIDSKNGYMLTNAHVVADAKAVQVTTRDNRKINGKVVGYDRESDIAVVQVADKKLPQAKLAAFTDPKQLDIGQQTIAIGNPFGQENTVTKGVLSAVGRTLPVPPNAQGEAFELKDMMQTDTPINPGNSGGPLCNAKGEVIGINTAIIPFGQGLGFTIPINKAKRIADEIIKNGKVAHPWIGVGLAPLDAQLQSDLGVPDKNGAVVKNVAPNSPAAKADLQAGDVVRKFNGKAVKDDKEIVAALKKAKVGDTVKLDVMRQGSSKSLTFKVGDRPQ